MPIKLCFVKQFWRSPWKPLNWKQKVVASLLLPEKKRWRLWDTAKNYSYSSAPLHTLLCDSNVGYSIC